MDSIDHLKELAIRYAARDQYKREGLLENPYPKNSIERHIWDKETLKIVKEKDNSVCMTN